MNNLKLWLRHPMRMIDFKFGYCPVCISSPPDPQCPVCEGDYHYGHTGQFKVTPETQALWLKRFRVWTKRRKE